MTSRICSKPYSICSVGLLGKQWLRIWTDYLDAQASYLLPHHQKEHDLQAHLIHALKDLLWGTVTERTLNIDVSNMPMARHDAEKIWIGWLNKCKFTSFCFSANVPLNSCRCGSRFLNSRTVLSFWLRVGRSWVKFRPFQRAFRVLPTSPNWHWLEPWWGTQRHGKPGTNGNSYRTSLL